MRLTRTEFGAIIDEKNNGPARRWICQTANNAARIDPKRYDLRAPEGAMTRRWFCSALLSLGALGPCAGYAQPTEPAPDTMEARVLACAPCHCAKGEGTNNAYFPRLAGKPAGYLANQLLAFHTGRRHYPPMNLSARLSSGGLLKEDSGLFRRPAASAATPHGS